MQEYALHYEFRRHRDPQRQNLLPRNRNIQHKYQYQIAQSIRAWTEMLRTILRIFTDRRCKTNITRSMVMDLWVRTRRSIQSNNPDLEPHEQLTSTEHIITITQDNRPNGWFIHEKAVRILYCHAQNTRRIVLCPSSQIRTTHMLTLIQEPHPQKKEWWNRNSTTEKE